MKFISAAMAPERVAKRFRRLYSRCEREVARYGDAEGLANARLSKVLTVLARWRLLGDDDSYVLATVGLKSKVLEKQAAVLQASIGQLEGAL